VDWVLAVCGPLLHHHSFAQTLPVPEGNHHPLLCPFGMFPARDGFVTIAALSDAHWSVLCRLMGRPELGGDPRFAVVQGRHDHQDEIVAAISEFTRRHTK